MRSSLNFGSYLGFSRAIATDFCELRSLTRIAYAMRDDAAECNAVVSLLRSLEVPARSHGAYIHRQILMKIFIFMYSLFIGVWSSMRRSAGGRKQIDAEGARERERLVGGECDG